MSKITINRHDDYRQRGILDGILEEKKDMSGKTGEIGTKSGVELPALDQYCFRSLGQ